MNKENYFLLDSIKYNYSFDSSYIRVSNHEKVYYLNNREGRDITEDEIIQRVKALIN